MKPRKKILCLIMALAIMLPTSSSLAVFADEPLDAGAAADAVALSAALSAPTFERTAPGNWKLTISEPLTAPQTITIGRQFYTPGDPVGFTGTTAGDQASSLAALFLSNSELNDNFNIAVNGNEITFTLKAPNTDPPIFAYTSFRRPASWWIDATHRGYDAQNLQALGAPNPVWQRPDRVRPLESWHKWENDGTFELIPTSETWFDVYKVPGGAYAFFEPGHDQEVMCFLIAGTSKAILFDTGMAIGNLRKAVEDVIAHEGPTLAFLNDLDDPDKFILVQSHTHSDHRADSWQFDTSVYVFDGIDNYDTRRMAKDTMLLPTYTYTATNPSDLLRDLPQQFIDDIAAAPGGQLVRPGVKAENVKLMREGDKFDLGGRILEVVHTPGHSPDGVSLLDLGKRVAFTGDWYYSGPNYAYSPATASFGAYYDSAQKINYKVNVIGTGVDWVYGAHNEAVKGGIIKELAEATQKIMDGDVVVGYGYAGEGNISGASWPNNPATGQRWPVQDLVEGNRGYIEWWFPSEASPTGNIRIQTLHKYGVGNVHPYKSAVSREVKKSELKGLKVVEILTSANASYVSRRSVATAETAAASPTATDAQKANLRVTERNRYEGLVPSHSMSVRPKREDPPPAPNASAGYPRLRELDDYYQAGLYDLPGVPKEIHELVFTNADANAKYGEEYPKFFAFAGELSEQVSDGLMAGKAVFIDGSDCIPGNGLLGGVRRAFGDDVKIGVIYLDAHGDVNTTHSTYSGFQGGMNLAPMIGLDRNMDPWWWAAAGGFLRPADASLQAGGRNLDWGPGRLDGNWPSKPYEKPFGELINMQNAGTIVSTVDDMNDPVKWRQQVKQLADQVDVIFLHIDYDFVDSAFGPLLGTPEPGWDGNNFARPEFSGPSIWTAMDNVKVIMEIDKVAVVYLASAYTASGSMPSSRITSLATMGWKLPPFVRGGEANWELVNKYSQPSILSSMQVAATVFNNWNNMVLPKDSADFADVVSSPVPAGNVDSLKVVELHSRSNAGTVGRNHVDPSNSAYSEEWVQLGRGAIRPSTDTIVVDNIVHPRELDDYHLLGIYGKAGVPYDISEMRISEAEAKTKYIDSPAYPEIKWNYQAYAREVSNQVYEGLVDGQAVFTCGDRCAPVVGVAGGVRRAFGNDKKIGIVYIDGHGDINSKYTTFSGSMGGMDLAAVLGVKDPLGVEDQNDWWEAAAGTGMRVFDESILATARDLDTGFDPNHGPFGEIMNLESVGGDWVKTEDFCNEDEWAKRVKAFADKVDVIYLHIDQDFLDPSYASNIGSNPPGGPSIWEARRAVETVMETDKVAVIYLAAVYFGTTNGTPWPNTEFDAYFGDPRGTNVYSMDEFPGETPDQRANRLSSFSILSAVRLISTMLENWDNMPVIPAGFSLSANEESDIDGSVEYILSLGKTHNFLSAELTFEVDGSMLAGKDVVPVNGFTLIDGVAWKSFGGDKWQGTVTLGYPAGDSEGFDSLGNTEIAKFIFAPRARGDATMKLTGVKVVGLDGDLTKYIDAAIIVGQATTNIDQRVFSKYDLNKDNKIDALDLGMMLLYCGFARDTAGWDSLVKVNDTRGVGVTANMCDVNGDGIIDMLDLLDLFIHYTK